VIRGLPNHEVTTVPASGWASIKNGKLLALIEQAGFDALITCDKNIEFQQHQLESRPFAVLLLSTNHWPSIKPHTAKIAEAPERAQPGSIHPDQLKRSTAAVSSRAVVSSPAVLSP